MNAQPLSRRLTGTCLIAAAALLLAGLILTPYPPHSGTRSYQDTLVAHAGRTQVAAIVIEISYVVLVAAVFGLIAHTHGAPRWLRTPGAVLAAIGSSILPGLLVTDIYDLTIARSLPRDTSVAIAERASNTPAAAIMSAPAAIGVALGTTLLVAAAWRIGLAPVWAAPLVLIAYIVGRALSPVPAVVGGTLLLVAYGTIGLRLLRNHQPAAALDTGILEHTRASNRTQDAAVQ